MTTSFTTFFTKDCVNFDAMAAKLSCAVDCLAVCLRACLLVNQEAADHHTVQRIMEMQRDKSRRTACQQPASAPARRSVGQSVSFSMRVTPSLYESGLPGGTLLSTLLYSDESRWEVPSKQQVGSIKRLPAANSKAASRRLLLLDERGMIAAGDAPTAAFTVLLCMHT